MLGRQRIQDFVAVGFSSRHDEVVSGGNAFCGGGASVGVCCGPVGHDDARKAPFLSCSGRAQIVAVGGMDTVYLVVGGHDRLWLGFFDCNFEALQVNLSQGALGDDARYAAAVFFLIVAGVMFDGRSDPVPALDASCEGCRHFSADERILGIVFEVAAAERIAVDIHARCKPEGHAELLQLCADHASHFLEKRRIERLRQKRSDRNRTAVLIVIFAVVVEEFGSENTVLETLVPVHFVNTAVRRIFLIM